MSVVVPFLGDDGEARRMLARLEPLASGPADELIVVADSGKFGHSELVHLCSLKQVARMVVDSGLPAEWQKRIREAGIDLVIAESGSRDA